MGFDFTTLQIWVNIVMVKTSAVMTTAIAAPEKVISM
jgi:hypothetical protein